LYFIGKPDSIYRIANEGATKAFRYRAVATPGALDAPIFLRARAALTHILSVGLMIDDGTNNADGNGSNNFYRVYLTQAVVAEAVNVVEQWRVGPASPAGAVTTRTTTFTLAPPLFYGIGLNTSGTRWSSWAARPFIFGESGEKMVYTFSVTGLTWTPARVGLYQVFVDSDNGRKAMYDWYDEATS